MLVNTKTNVTSLLVIDDDKVAYLTFSSKTWDFIEKFLVCLKATPK